MLICVEAWKKEGKVTIGVEPRLTTRERAQKALEKEVSLFLVIVPY